MPRRHSQNSDIQGESESSHRGFRAVIHINQLFSDSFARQPSANRRSRRRRSIRPAAKPVPPSHIQVASHPDAAVSSEQAGSTSHERSLQDETETTSEFDRLAPTMTDSGSSQTSLAPVVAPSLPENGHRSRSNSSSDAANEEAFSSSPGDSKANKKKAKKWAPLDLGDVGYLEGLEGEREVAYAATAASASDELSSFLTAPPIDPGLLPNFHNNNASPANSIASDQSGKHQRALFFDAGEASTVTTKFDAAFPQLQSQQAHSSSPTEGSRKTNIIHDRDPDDTKHRLEAIMARIDDLFDVEEWNPSLPAESIRSDSPEPLKASPQRVTYNTVGSVAKNNEVPKFSPPVRIQREGAARRMGIPLTPNHNLDNYYGRNHQHGLGNGYPHQMHAERFSRSASQQHSQRSFDTSGMEKSNMQDFENSSSFDNSSSDRAAAHSGNFPGTPQRPHERTPDNSVNDTSSYQPSLPGLVKDQGIGSNPVLPGSSTYAGLNKMQTLQRLAQFNNPAQAFAKTRLAKLKPVNMQEDPVNAVRHGHELSQSPSTVQQRNKDDALQYGSEDSFYKNESQGRAAQPLGPNNDDRLHDTQRHSHNIQGGGDVPPAYPRPLTAGPPGQRWQAGTRQRLSNKLAPSLEHSRSEDKPQHISQTDGRLAWDPVQHQNGDNFQRENLHLWPTGVGLTSQHPTHSFSSAVTADSNIRETLSVTEMAKYFPGGSPHGFNLRGAYKPLDAGEGKFLHELGAKTPAQNKLEDLDKWFYGGLERFDMSMKELDNRDAGLLPPTAHGNFAGRKTYTMKEINHMSEAECAGPLIASLLGTLAAYTSSRIEPTDRRVLSRFVQSSAWASPPTEGETSLF